jgi:hypothetical protein
VEVCKRREREKEKGRARTEDEDEDPCAVADEEEEDRGPAPAVTERDDKLEKSEEEEDGLERNKGDAVRESISEGGGGGSKKKDTSAYAKRRSFGGDCTTVQMLSKPTWGTMATRVTIMTIFSAMKSKTRIEVTMRLRPYKACT